MSWLSQGLSDIGLGSLNQNFSNLETAVNKQPAWAKGLELGGLGLGGALLAPEALAALGLGGAATAAPAAAGAGTDFLGGVNALNAASDFGGVAGADALLGGSGATLGDAGTSALALTDPSVGLATDPAQAAISNALTGGSTGVGSGVGIGSFDPAAFMDPAAAGGTNVPIGGITADTAGGGGFMGTGISGGALAGIGGLGAASILGQLIGPRIAPQDPGTPALQGVANQAAGQGNQQYQYGQQLQQPELTGQLPAGAQTAVDNALHDAITGIKARYASLGLSGSTEEQQAITAAQNQSTATQFQIAQQMAQQGQAAVQSATADLGLQEQVYSAIMNATLQQDENLSNAISGFASAVGQGLAVGTGQGLAKQALTT